MEEEFVQIKSDLPCTYNFIYKNKKYPIILYLLIIQNTFYKIKQKLWTLKIFKLLMKN